MAATPSPADSQLALRDRGNCPIAAKFGTDLEFLIVENTGERIKTGSYLPEHEPLEQEVRPSGTEELSDCHGTWDRPSVRHSADYRSTGNDITKAEVTS